MLTQLYRQRAKSLWAFGIPHEHDIPLTIFEQMKISLQVLQVSEQCPEGDLKCLCTNKVPGWRAFELCITQERAWELTFLGFILKLPLESPQPSKVKKASNHQTARTGETNGAELHSDPLKLQESFSLIAKATPEPLEKRVPVFWSCGLTRQYTECSKELAEFRQTRAFNGAFIMCSILPPSAFTNRYSRNVRPRLQLRFQHLGYSIFLQSMRSLETSQHATCYRKWNFICAKAFVKKIVTEGQCNGPLVQDFTCRIFL